jgi:hypothetical protein
MHWIKYTVALLFPQRRSQVHGAANAASRVDQRFPAAVLCRAAVWTPMVGGISVLLVENEPYAFNTSSVRTVFVTKLVA